MYRIKAERVLTIPEVPDTDVNMGTRLLGWEILAAFCFEGELHDVICNLCLLCNTQGHVRGSATRRLLHDCLGLAVGSGLLGIPRDVQLCHTTSFVYVVILYIRIRREKSETWESVCKNTQFHS